MNNTKPRLVYADRSRGDHWFDGFHGQRRDHLLGLQNMCDFGAEQFHRGVTDLLAIDCMPDECDAVRKIMAERHPTVAYAFGSGERVLRAVLNEALKVLE